MRRVIGLLLLSLPSILAGIDARALEVPAVDTQLQSQGFEGNWEAVKRGRDVFYQAFKVQGEKWRGVEVSAFADAKGSGPVKQLRWVALNCTFSKVSDSDVLAAFLSELKKAYRPLFGADFPKPLETWLAGTEKEGALSLEGFKKVRLTRYAAYCDSTRGGTSVTVDFFLKPASETIPRASPAGS